MISRESTDAHQEKKPEKLTKLWEWTWIVTRNDTRSSLYQWTDVAPSNLPLPQEGTNYKEERKRSSSGFFHAVRHLTINFFALEARLSDD